MSFKIQERQYLKISVHDYDSDSKNLQDHDFLGKISQVFFAHKLREREKERKSR